jgi:hypothetical protein
VAENAPAVVRFNPDMPSVSGNDQSSLSYGCGQN